MNKTHATIADVAKLSGKSTATISRYLNESPNVSEDARRSIARAIEELGYVPSASARGLANRQTGMIGLVLQVFPGYRDIPAPAAHNGIEFDPIGDGVITSPACDNYINEIVRGAESAAWEANCAITISIARGENLEARIIDMASRVDGMILVNDPLPAPLLEQVARRVAVVSVAGSEHHGISDYVYSANETAIDLVLEHVTTQHNAKEFFFVAGHEDSADDQQRFSAFQKGLANAGIIAPQKPQYRANFLLEDAKAVALEVVNTLDWSSSAPLRAFICSNDETAVGMLDVFAKAGIRVPEQALITGFDDCHISKSVRPRLTSVKQSTHGLGTLAVTALMDRIASPSRGKQVLFAPVSVMIRESCGPHAVNPTRGEPHAQ